MALSQQFLDDLKSRVTLSSLIGRMVKLERAGREFKACCPFHQERTPSFNVVDEKGFYHCHGCGAHGDAIRWLTDHDGLGFMDAVRQLAASAGMEVPARSPEEARREGERDRVDQILDKAAGWYAEQLRNAPKVLELLHARGITDASIAKFGLGYAPSRLSVAQCGIAPATLNGVGLMYEAQEGRDAGLWRDRFRQRIMIPLQDARGRTIGFAGRATEADTLPKYTNSPESPHFQKGDVLFNLHRASAAARSARRLLLVEGQLDTIALFGIGGASAATLVKIEAASAQPGTFIPLVVQANLLAGANMPRSGKGTALLTIPATSLRFLRLSFTSLASTLEISRVALGKRIVLARNFGLGGSFGVRDLGAVEFNPRGVMIRRRGRKMRTASVIFSNIYRDELEVMVQPLIEQIGNTETVLLVTNPEEHPDRQNRCYFGFLVGDLEAVQRKATAFETKANIVSIF